MAFVDKIIHRLAEDRATGGEDEAADAGFSNGFEKMEAVHNIVVEIFGRVGHRFADECGTGEVHGSIDLSAQEDFAKSGAIGEIATEEFSGQDVAAMADGEVIDSKDIVPGFGKHEDHVRTDVPGSARHEYGCHDESPLET